jgi:YfiH family protein
MTLPSISDTFAWTRESWGLALRCRPLETVASHLFTTRQLALTSQDDERRMAEAVGATHVVLLTQVHGSAVVAVTKDLFAPNGRPEADVLVSDHPELAIAVRAADCVPILMADRRTRAVAAVHAGWRGTAARASVAAVTALTRHYGTDPADLVVAIGPSIGGCCYEIGPELVDAFAAAGHERHLIDRWFLAPPPARGSRERPRMRLDLTGANRDQLVLAGVPDEQIHIAGLCTAMNLELLTSYRVEKEQAGRIAGVIKAS